MKKIILLLLGLSVIGGSVFALFPGLFPDTPAFPRIPIGDGTVGKIFTKLLWTNDLANYAGDWTVPNSLTLSWVSATGYLKDDSSCTWGQKFIGIDSTGKRVCGTVNVLLTDYATIQGQDCPADYYRIDNTQGQTATWNILKAWDIVKTPPGCTMTIVFADSSILRLDGDTTISFDLGTLPDGSTIASAMLSNGSVWWRILTETWSYNVWTEIIVVWVRWTSIALSSTGNTISITNTGSWWGILKTPSTSQTYVNLVDSRFSSGASMRCKSQITHLLESLDDLKVGDSYAINPLWCPSVKPTPILLQKHINFGNAWIRKNVRKDIEYMYKLWTVSGSLLSPSKRSILRDEILATIPNTLVNWTFTASGGGLEATSICESWYQWWNERYSCVPSNILAVADFTTPAISDITNTWSSICPENIALSVFPWRLPTDHLCRQSSSGTFLPWVGFRIAVRDYLSFNWSEISYKLGGYGSLVGKTIKLNLSEHLGFPFPNTKRYLFDWWSSIQYWATNWVCNPGDPAWLKICKKEMGVISIYDSYNGTDTVIHLNISSDPMLFIIGNNGAGSLWITNTIKSFSLE